MICSTNDQLLLLKARRTKQTHQIPGYGHSLLDGCGAARVADAVVDLGGDPGEGLAGGRGEVVAEAEEVGEEEGGEEAGGRRGWGEALGDDGNGKEWREGDER